jgi:hypothetical protein
MRSKAEPVSSRSRRRARQEMLYSNRSGSHDIFTQKVAIHLLVCLSACLHFCIFSTGIGEVRELYTCDDRPLDCSGSGRKFGDLPPHIRVVRLLPSSSIEKTSSGCSSSIRVEPSPGEEMVRSNRPAGADTFLADPICSLLPLDSDESALGKCILPSSCDSIDIGLFLDGADRAANCSSEVQLKPSGRAVGLESRVSGSTVSRNGEPT